MPVALGALPGAEDEIALHGRCEAARDAVRARRPVTVRAAAQDAARRPWGEALVEVLREQLRVPRAQVGLEGVHRGLLVIAVVALHRRGVHRDDDLRAGGPHYPHDPAQQLIATPHLAREGSAGGVVEVESVEVVDVRDTGKRHGIAFLDLTEQPQSRALLQADGVSSTLATSGRDDPDLDVVELVPLELGRASCRESG